MIVIKCSSCQRKTNIYSTQDAADHLKISVYAMKYHIYKGHVTPQLMGHSLMFTERQLGDPDFTKHLREQPVSDQQAVL